MNWPFICINLSPLRSRMLCAKFCWNWLSGSSMYFSHFVNISPWKRMWLFIWGNLNPLHPRMIFLKFGWNWPSGSWWEDENVKSLQTDGRWTTGDQISSSEHIKKWQKISNPIWNIISTLYLDVSKIHCNISLRYI